MGSKRAMLQNGLGELLREESKRSKRVVDLFCGAGSVSWFAATSLEKPVISVDLQQYAAVLAGAVVSRTREVDCAALSQQWLSLAFEAREEMGGWSQALELDARRVNTATWRKWTQDLCGSAAIDRSAVITQKYGGYYYAAKQALTIDALLQTIPFTGVRRTVCLAALIEAAAQCAASPGHTAQPFRASRTAGKFLREAWQKDPIKYLYRALERMCPQYATALGKARVADANVYAAYIRESDLVFVDPPYSAVHYSRFYHVLETIARGNCGDVSGAGRYPPRDERPSSLYSCKMSSQDAMQRLLSTLAARGCRVVITFPRDECSNGMSGHTVEELAKQSFAVVRRSVKTRFSTLGGNTANRAARKVSDELMLVLSPR